MSDYDQLACKVLLCTKSGYLSYLIIIADHNCDIQKQQGSHSSFHTSIICVHLHTIFATYNHNFKSTYILVWTFVPRLLTQFSIYVVVRHLFYYYPKRQFSFFEYREVLKKNDCQCVWPECFASNWLVYSQNKLWNSGFITKSVMLRILTFALCANITLRGK